MIWLLKQHDQDSCIETLVLIIRADNEEKARKVAYDKTEGYEEKEVWLDNTKSDCLLINSEGNTEVILQTGRGELIGPTFGGKE